MHLAYEDLPSEIKSRLAQMTATHNFEKFWEHMRRNHSSERPAMTDEQRRRRPPVIPGVLDASDHRAEGAVLQSWLRVAHQRTARA